MHTDTLNRFVNVSVKSEESSITCIFLDPLLKNYTWHCTIMYGPVNLYSDCRNLESDETPAISGKSSRTNVNDIWFGRLDLGNNTKLCVTATIRSGVKKWRLEGIYNINSAQSIFQVQTSLLRHLGSIELLVVILMYYMDCKFII